MKKSILLLILSLICMMMYAQKIDKKLLYGKWDLYSANSQGYTACRDSMAQLIAAVVKVYKDYPDGLGPDDSLKLVKDLKDRFTYIFKTYYTFDEKGNLIEMLCKDGGDCSEDTGKYQWTAINQITHKMKGGTDTDILSILSLTDAILVIKVEDLSTGDVAELTFTRAK